MHKWFARRPGTVFRSLLLAEFNGTEPLESAYWRAHRFGGVIADPFMGGGTPVYEAARLGFNVVATDINPMAYWIVRQSLGDIDVRQFEAEAASVAKDVETLLGNLYRTRCLRCDRMAEVKYFLWVKQQACPNCNVPNDLFPGYLLAEAVRHPAFVVACSACGELNECERKPTKTAPGRCAACTAPFAIDGPAKRQRMTCGACGSEYRYPSPNGGPPRHRMWAIEYHCRSCKPSHAGRFFKRPDEADLALFAEANQRFEDAESKLPLPDDAVPAGDETDRLHRWGYRHYREMFNARQLLGLGSLMARIRLVQDTGVRHALLTVFSDFLRYQNMLCRYDTYALKCQDIFSVHGFPVGLVQCENNLLGIASVGSGAFRHFVQKYARAKRYCASPFETKVNGRGKVIVPIPGERIGAKLVRDFPSGPREALIAASTASAVDLPPESLDGVFTDPPYYDNVQYAELMDFCFVWLRMALGDEFEEFRPSSTRTLQELTGNVTLGRGLDHFTEGLSVVFAHYARALKTGAPFVFTFHHNDPAAYVPLVVAVLDAGLTCTVTHPVAAEMGASLHIAGTNSSILDSVFVCRRSSDYECDTDIERSLCADAKAMEAAGIRVSQGDVACLMAGHIARVAISKLHRSWDEAAPLARRIAAARRVIEDVSATVAARGLPARVVGSMSAA